MNKEKSMTKGLLLIVFFGPVGLFYASKNGGLLMLALCVLGLIGIESFFSHVFTDMTDWSQWPEEIRNLDVRSVRSISVIGLSIVTIAGLALGAIWWIITCVASIVWGSIAIFVHNRRVVKPRNIRMDIRHQEKLPAETSGPKAVFPATPPVKKTPEIRK